MAVNLEPGRRAMERLMEDECAIRIDPEGGSDDVMDPGTGELTPVSPDARDIYSGPCLLTAQGNVGREGGRGGGTFQVTGYTLQVPVSAPALEVGAQVEITSSKRDPNQVGRLFRIERTTYSTMALTRKASLIAEEEVPTS